MNRRGAWRHLGLAVVTVCAAGALAQPAGADLRGEFRKIAALRDGLLEALASRQAADRQKGPAQDFHLVLDEGADRADMRLVLRRCGGQWRAGYADVPAWTQGTMQEWRGFHLSNGAGTAWRANQRFAADPAGLKVDADRLAGTLSVEFRLDETLDEQLPPGTAVSWWDRFIPTGHATLRKQSFMLDAEVYRDVRLFDLVLEGGVNWVPQKPRKGQAPQPLRRPIFVRLQAPCGRFTLARVQTPTWNGGYHEGDATGLTFKDGRLSGTLVVFLHQDGWIPWGAGKTYQHAPQVLRMEIDARLKHHVLSGTFRATGDMGDYDGQVRGRGGRAVIGRYSARGEIGRHVGSLHGIMLDDPAGLREQVPPEADLPGDDAAAARQVAARVNDVLHQARALHLALQHYGLPLAEALAQTDTAAPVWSGAGTAEAAALAEYCRQAADLLAKAAPPDARLPEPRPEGVGDSPSLGAVPAPVRDAEINVIPPNAPAPRRGGTDDDQWLFLTRWRVLGPFHQRAGLENDTGLVAEVVPLAGLSYRQEIDRFGARRRDAESHTWQAVTCDGPRLAAPWDKPGFYNRFAGEAWYAAASVQSERDRPAWLSLESAAHAKLWVNGRLVWSDTEKPWRYRPRGRVFVGVSLAAGANELLVRCHRDRRPSWVRLAILARQPASPPAPARPEAAAPAPDTTPPLAWDIDDGINVAWRNTDLGGHTSPLATGDALLVTTAPHTLHCLDPATGKVRWSGEANILELIDAKALDAWRAGDDAARAALLARHAEQLGLRAGRIDDLRPSDPVTDGRLVWVHAGTGAAACYDLQGKRLWMQRTGLTKARLHPCARLLVVEGAASGVWPVPKELADPRAGKRNDPIVGVLVLDGRTGQERGRWSLRGSFSAGRSRLLTVGGPGRQAAVLLTSTGAMIDVVAGKLLGPMDVERPGAAPAGGQIIGAASGPFALCANAEAVFLTSQEQSVAVRLWTTPDGRLAYAPLWESNYEHGGFGSFVAPSAATERLLFSWQPVLERGPHCPDGRLELHVQDARTGRPLARLKPALENAVRSDAAPVLAGGYVFCVDSGGGTHGGHETHGQVVVATADEKLRVVCRNLVDLGTAVGPVFRGERMYLRSGRALTCIAVTTERGRRYQNERLARTLLADLGASPTTAEPREIAPAEGLAPGDGVPVGRLIDGRTTEYWLGAGPFPGGAGDEKALADLCPRAGDGVAFAGRTRQFQPLGREFACNDPPLYQRQYVLQGTGDIVPLFAAHVDPRCVSGPGGAGLLYTVLDNTRDRVVLPTLKARGVDLFLSGRRLKPDQPLHLPAGLYPLLIRVDPGYYKVETKEVIPPVDVAKALQKGALKDIGWPKTWQVIGPLPPDSTPLTPAELRRPPDRITVGERDYPAFAIPVEDGTLYLTGLVDLRPGQKPDVANAPRTVRIGVPSLAYCFATIECPADGTLYVTTGGDWFMRWCVDGEAVYDTMKGGNAAAATDLAAHPFAVRITKGRHVLAVQIKPGSKGWSLTSLGGFSDRPEQLADLRVPSRIKPEEPDFRFAPAFQEIPHPPTRMRQWLQRARDRRAALQAVARDLPGTEEATAAVEVLERIEE